MIPQRTQSARSRHNRNKNGNGQRFRAAYFIAILIAGYLLFISFRAIKSSVILDRTDRINVMFYDEEAILLSYGLTDDVNYIVSFSHIDRVSVPGGYGRYRVGSLGKLASLEKDPDLMLRTISSMTSSYVDFYVYENNSQVYDKLDTDSPSFQTSALISQLFSPNVQTNASFFDKLYISYLLAQRRPQDFVVLRSISDEAENGEYDFSEKRFLKKYKGFFYHQELREESKEVQILYNSYPGAVTLSRVIEGQGIRVVDLAETDEELKDRCLIRYSDRELSKTAVYLKNRFGCALQQGDTEGSDIIFTMGSLLTEEWK